MPEWKKRHYQEKGNERQGKRKERSARQGKGNVEETPKRHGKKCGAQKGTQGGELLIALSGRQSYDVKSVMLKIGCQILMPEK